MPLIARLDVTFSGEHINWLCSKVADFDGFCASARMRGFEVFVAEVTEEIEVCAARNIHDRSREEIEKASHVHDGYSCRIVSS